MFRRRRVIRPILRPAVRAVVPPVIRPGIGRPKVPPALLRANELMSAGNYAEAADIFDQFARGAELRGGPRAAQFFLQAGRCRILAGQVPAGMTALKHGLTILANRGDFQHMQNAGRRAVAELNQKNMKAEAAEIETMLAQMIPAGFTPAATSGGATEKKRLLPTKCPSCGGSLVADEVVWLDETTAECPYCGSGVRAE